MKTDYLRQKEKLVPIVLLGAAAIFAVLILIKTTGFLMTLARAQDTVERATEQNNAEANNVDKYLAQNRELADGLKTNNLFAPPPPKQHPVKEVAGILGDEVLIEGRWYEVGAMIGDAKILAIGPASARIGWNGAEKVFSPISAPVSESAKGSQAEKAAAKAGKADMVVIQSARKSMSDPKSWAKKSMSDRKDWGKGQSQKPNNDWARKMSMDELRGVHKKIEEHIAGLRAKGVTDPAAYEGARRKMQTVEGAMWERRGSK
jgi:hypothetical protein